MNWFDQMVNIVQAWADILLFHHPAVWWISHTIRTEREYCCDNAVITLTSDQVDYAKALTSLVEIRNHVPQLAVAASGGSLLARIRHILTADGETSLHPNRSAGWSFIALLIVILAFAAGLTSDTVLAVPHQYGATTDNGEYQTLQQMIGPWIVNTEQSTAAGHIEHIEIKADATCIRYERAHGADLKTFYDKIQLKQNTLIVSGYWGKQSFTLQVSDKTMTWTSPEISITFERQAETSPSKNTGPRSIIGTWHTNEVPAEMGNVIKSMTIIFRPNGTATMKRIGTRGMELVVKNAQYKVAADTIELLEDEPGETPETLLWEIRGEFLYLGEQQDEMIKFEKSLKGESYSTTVNDLIGDWKMVGFIGDNQDNIDSINLTFRSDGSWHSLAKGPKGSDFVDDDKGTYRIQEGKPRFDRQPDVDLSLQGRRLAVVLEDGTKIIFEKKPKVTTNPEALIGKWKCEDAPGGKNKPFDFIILEFRLDHSGLSSRIGFDGQEVGSELFEYRVEGNTIFTKGSDSDDIWDPIQWRIEDDILHLTEDTGDDDGDLEAYTFKRIDSLDQSTH